MKGVNPEMMNKLQQGAFMHHIPGIYNSNWTDMFIETTYIRLGPGPAGTTGMAADYHQIVKWALSIVLTGEVSPYVLAMSNNEQYTLHLDDDSHPDDTHRYWINRLPRRECG